MPTRSEWKIWRSLSRRKGRREHGLFLAEGPHLLSELLDSGRTPEHVLHTDEAAANPAIEGLLGRLAAAGASATAVAPRELAELSDTTTPQGVIAIAAIPSWGWPEIATPRILLLDGVRDPGNAGALIRTSAALGAGGAVALTGSADPWGAKTVRAAAGASLRFPVLSAGWAETKDRLDERGIPVWVAESDGAPFERGDRAPDAVALALGNEAAGVTEAVRAASRRSVAIRMSDGVESLNVAAAGAILMDRLFDGSGDKRG